jgi:hypothetical protein
MLGKRVSRVQNKGKENAAAGCGLITELELLTFYVFALMGSPATSSRGASCVATVTLALYIRCACLERIPEGSGDPMLGLGVSFAVDLTPSLNDPLLPRYLVHPTHQIFHGDLRFRRETGKTPHTGLSKASHSVFLILNSSFFPQKVIATTSPYAALWIRQRTYKRWKLQLSSLYMNKILLNAPRPRRGRFVVSLYLCHFR